MLHPFELKFVVYVADTIVLPASKLRHIQVESVKRFETVNTDERRLDVKKVFMPRPNKVGDYNVSLI